MAFTQHDLGCRPVAPASKVGRRRWLSVLLAMAAATAVTGIAGPVAGIDLTVETGSGAFTVEPLYATLTSLAAGLAGWALLELLERWTANARLVWAVTACGVFLVSLLGPLSATTLAAAAVLTGLHALVALVVGWGLCGSPRPSPRHR